MKLVYVASGIAVPGAYGGSIHTLEVARGLADRGHEIHVVAHHPVRRWETLLRPTTVDYAGVQLHYIDLPKALGLASYPAIARLIADVRPDAVMERYYNLAGAGVLAAHRRSIPSLLEVNALIVDPPAVLKRRLDDRFGRPLQLLALAQCHMAARIVTPLHTTVPPQIERNKIVELPWGANVERFRPKNQPAERARLRRELGIPEDRPVVVFLGSFRAWHGITDAVAAVVRLLEQGRDLHLLLIGDGPERAAAEAAVGPWHRHITFAGSVDHDEVPRYLALADLAVAPFNTAPHPALRAAGFFWSPLKVYEYMAMGLPVVTAAIPPLDTTIREGMEGALFREGDLDDLAAAISRVLDASNHREMGQRARARVVERFSWREHCAALERVLESMISERAVHG